MNYDILIIATGTRINPEETPGLTGELWHKKIFDFYTIEGSMALSNFFKSWEGGKLVMILPTCQSSVLLHHLSLPSMQMHSSPKGVCATGYLLPM
ncbi:MAG: hypothetical protein R2744_10125 [Bacteroidales bacterium]